ncbi:MAG: hypothetical protein AAGG44_05385, partial [Planctomycetota bacterium]
MTPRVCLSVAPISVANRFQRLRRTQDVRAFTLLVSHLVLRYVALVSFFLSLAGHSCAAAKDVDSEKAMRAVGSTSWYDRNNDEFQTPEPDAYSDNEIRVDGRRAEEKPEGSWGR